jgi:uncharacterized protein
MIRNLSEEQSREVLRRERVARLGCIADGFPYVVPVNFVFDGLNAVVHSLPGRKVVAMRENPRVCLQVDEIEDDWNWKSVLAFGRYEEINSGDEVSSAMGMLLARFPQLTPVESIIAEDAGAPRPIVFRILIESVTGISETR